MAIDAAVEALRGELARLQAMRVEIEAALLTLQHRGAIPGPESRRKVRNPRFPDMRVLTPSEETELAPALRRKLNKFRKGRLHWTQRPENKARLLAMAKRSARTRNQLAASERVSAVARRQIGKHKA